MNKNIQQGQNRKKLERGQINYVAGCGGSSQGSAKASRVFEGSRVKKNRPWPPAAMAPDPVRQTAAAIIAEHNIYAKGPKGIFPETDGKKCRLSSRSVG